MPTRFEEIRARMRAEADQRIGSESIRELVQSFREARVTLGDFVSQLQAENGGWEYAKDMPLSELASILRPNTGPALQAKRGGVRQRLSGPEKAALEERIVAHVKANPWSGSRQIATALGAQPLQVSRLVKAMVGKQIKKQGEKAATVYAVAGEKSKPKA